MTGTAKAQETSAMGADWPRRVIVVGLKNRPLDLVRAVLEAETLELEVTEVSEAAEAAGRDGDLIVAFGAATAGEVRALAPRATVVAILTERVTTTAVRRLLDRGVRGVVRGENWPAALGPVCRAVSAGQICVPAGLRGALESPTLSLRERQVLALITEGLSNADIAKQLFLAESTVKSHAAAAFRRLGVNSRREAVALVLGSDEDLRRIVLTAQPPDRSVASHGRYRLEARP